MAKYPEGTRKNGYIVEGGKWVPDSGAQASPQTVETAIPAPLAEYAGGVNRGMARLGDFFTTNPVNAVSNLVGSDFRVPTLEQGLESVTGGTSGFMEPGVARDVVSAAGEWTPSFASMKMPIDPPRMTGSSTQLLDDAAPSINALKNRAGDLYAKIDQMQSPIPSQYLAGVVDDLSTTLKKRGLDKDLSPKAYAVLSRVDSELTGNEPVSIGSLETLRRVAGAAVKDPNPLEASLGKAIQNKIDDLVAGLPDDVVGQGGSETLKQARLLTQQRKKAETIEQAVEMAKTYASGYENGLKLQFQNLQRQIIRGTLKGYTKDEIAAIRKVANGGPVENVARLLGKFGAAEGSAMRALVPGLGAGVGYGIGSAVGGPVGGVVGAASTLATGQAFRNLASRLTQKNATLASALVRAGPNARVITSEYLRRIPKDSRSAEELASLFYTNRVPIPQLQKIVETKAFAPEVIEAAMLASQAANTAEEL